MKDSTNLQPKSMSETRAYIRGRDIEFAPQQLIFKNWNLLQYFEKDKKIDSYLSADPNLDIKKLGPRFSKC